MPVELTGWKRPAVSSVTVFGPFRGPTGYDHHVREFARELDRREVEVRLLELPWSPARLSEDLHWFEEREGQSTARHGSAVLPADSGDPLAEKCDD